jgi:hypothetical protein
MSRFQSAKLFRSDLGSIRANGFLKQKEAHWYQSGSAKHQEWY